ncbi:hypothetical protein VULLAG_LOCUS7094 [Vulpes lagopus]
MRILTQGALLIMAKGWKQHEWQWLKNYGMPLRSLDENPNYGMEQESTSFTEDYNTILCLPVSQRLLLNL